MILANCEISDAPWIAERITSVANAATIRWWGEELSAPVSFGVATAEYGDSMESLIERARKSLDAWLPGRGRVRNLTMLMRTQSVCLSSSEF